MSSSEVVSEQADENRTEKLGLNALKLYDLTARLPDKKINTAILPYNSKLDASL